MRIYEAGCPIEVEFRSQQDRVDVRHDQAVKLSTSVVVDLCSVEVEVERSAGHVRVEGVRATNESEAYTRAKRLASTALAALSLELQGHNPNQHLGHIRLAPVLAQMSVSPRDATIAESVDLRLVTHLAVMEAQAFADAASRSEDLRFLLAAYDAAIGPLDVRSKFYNAFTIIEHVESTRTADVSPRRLLTKAQRLAVERVLEEHLTREVGAEVARLARQRIANPLAQATHESRDTKLLRILVDAFGISEIEYAAKKWPVDHALVATFTKTRNGLFHGATTGGDAKIADTTGKLIKVVERALRHLLLAAPCAAEAPLRNT
jgi:hypothetical protein